MDKETKDKLIKLRALLETKVQIADSEKNDYSVIRIVGFGLDNIFKILNIETPLDDRFGNLNSKLKNDYLKDCQKDIGFFPKEFDNDFLI
jgi:tRNA(His) 5'-end guanylyltransferase